MKEKLNIQMKTQKREHIKADNERKNEEKATKKVALGG